MSGLLISLNISILFFKSLKLLSVMAAIRLDDNDSDNIDKTLSLTLVDSSKTAVKDRSITAVDPLASSTWEQVCFAWM